MKKKKPFLTPRPIKSPSTPTTITSQFKTPTCPTGPLEESFLLQTLFPNTVPPQLKKGYNRVRFRT